MKERNVTWKKTSERQARMIRFVLLFAALLMIAAGAMTDEVQTMFTKAIYICMECIGLG